MLKAAINLVLSILLFSLPVSAYALSKHSNTLITPFTAQYNIIHKGDLVGTGVRELVYLENGDVDYSYKTDIEWLIFSDSRKEKSILSLDNGIITPKHYLYERTGTGRDKRVEWQFVPEKNQAVCIEESEDDHTINLSFANQLQDKLSYHLQQRLNLIKNPMQKQFVYSVIQNSGKTKNYVYEYEGEEELMLPYGTVKAIKFKREVIEKKKITYVWFAPELDYLLVRLYQIKADVAQFEAQLDKYALQ